LADEAAVRNLRDKLWERRAFVLPGVFNPLSARLVASLGFEAAYVTGAGLSNMGLGLPDLGFIGLKDVAEEVTRVRDAVDLPLVVDADTGFGNAVNTWHTVKVLERAGANAIQIEDQTFPKRCGHFAGKDVVPLPEMIGRIKAAVDARTRGTLVIARTDAAALEGFDAAVERANRLAEAGADVLFVEALESSDELLALPRLVSRPTVANMVVGGRSPILDQKRAADAGYGCLLYANAALQAALHGMQGALRELQAKGRLDEQSGLLASFTERQQLVEKPLYDALEERYSTPD
jgi:2-methylisocitrate lyase-like PEP mutase family enzyme